MDSVRSNVAEFPKAADAMSPVVEGAVCAPETHAMAIPLDIFEAVMEITRSVVGWSDNFRAVSVTWDIGTHVHKLFDTYAIKRYKGGLGTGKTRSQDVDEQLTFQPVCFTSETDAVMFREAARGGTMILDEVTSLGRETKKVLLKGFHRGGVVLRNHQVSRRRSKTKDGNTDERTESDYEVKRHSVYCPKILAGQGSINDTAVESRTITYNMNNAPRRADGSKWRGPLPADFFTKSAALKEEIGKWAASMRMKATPYGAPEGQVPAWMDGRQMQTFNALYCLMPLAYRPALDAIAKEHCEHIQRETADEPESFVKDALLEVVSIPKGEASITFYPQTVADEINRSRSGDDEVTAKYVGSQLALMGFERELNAAGKPNRTTRGIPYVATKASMERIRG